MCRKGNGTNTKEKAGARGKENIESYQSRGEYTRQGKHNNKCEGEGRWCEGRTAGRIWKG